MATRNNPFMPPEFTRMFADMRIPGIEMDALLDWHRKNMAAFAAANQLVAESAQAFALRQGEIVRQSMDEASAMLQEVMSANAPETKIERQGVLMKRSYDRALCNMRELGELVAKSGG